MIYYAVDQGVFDAVNARMQGANDQIIPEAFLNRVSGRVSRGEHVIIAGNTAAIPIVGVIEKTVSFFSFLFGNSTMQGDIIQAINDANANDQVETIVLEIDSPGGSVEGLQSVVDAIRVSNKPVVSMVTDKAASAAYWIASQTESITVNNTAAVVGSIGVIARMRVDDDIVTLTSSNAPNKVLDPSTEAGRDKIVAYLDELAERFTADVAEGRNTTSANVNKDFGQGRAVLAEAALAAGMIDNIGVQEISPTAPEQAIEKESVMDLKELKAKHPDVYAAAKAEGIAEGVDQEKDRTVALLELGAKSGDMDRAVKAVQDDESLTGKGSQTLVAHFIGAGLNKNQLDASADDSPGNVNTGSQDDPDAAASDEKDKDNVFAFDDEVDVEAGLKEGLTNG